MVRKRNKPGRIGADVAEEGFSDVPVVEVHGDSTVFLSGCRCIEDYAPGEVVVLTGLGNVVLRGDGLTLRSFAGDKIAVEGRVTEISLPKEKRDAAHS